MTRIRGAAFSTADGLSVTPFIEDDGIPEHARAGFLVSRPGYPAEEVYLTVKPEHDQQAFERQGDKRPFAGTVAGWLRVTPGLPEVIMETGLLPDYDTSLPNPYIPHRVSPAPGTGGDRCSCGTAFMGSARTVAAAAARHSRDVAAARGKADT